ncbi:MFS transporter [Porphyromonas pogonae]|uniref:MFS transporter n=1 Tax=Porphyromonas pogonae TaxID=867595 RepID=UPI002E79F4EA|nr:MFS transporter [Porphyromonas pogonae]
MKRERRTPWAWIPTLYFAEGLPYVAVMTIAVIMYKRLGLSNTDIALYTSWLYFPWVIKPLWSPFVDLIKTKRFWIVSMQGLIAAAFAGIAFFIPADFYVRATLACFWLMAFSSATHDIAADGFYMLGLTTGEQALFVGIRNTFYRLANIFGQGILVMIAGLIEQGVIFPSLRGNIPLAWSLTFYLMAGLFILFTLYHFLILPYPAQDKPRKEVNASQLFSDFGKTFATFFRKRDLGLMFFFLLTYRLGESQLAKIAAPFLLDSVDKGGMALNTATVGMIYGTIGVIALLVGGIISGYLVSRDGYRKWLIPMALAINIPDLLYVLLAYLQPLYADQLQSMPTWTVGAMHMDRQMIWNIIVSVCVAIEQLGYGFGFTAYMMYLIYIADGEYKTAHYAIATGFMALGMMLPGIPAGKIQELLGYSHFFIWVCVCTIPGIIAANIIRHKMEPDFGKRTK